MTTEDNSTGYGNLGDLDPEARKEIREFRSQFFEQKSKGGIEDTIGSTRKDVRLSFNVLARLLAEQEAREDRKDKDDVSETDIEHTLEPLYAYYDIGKLSDEEVRDWIRELAKELGYGEEDDYYAIDKLSDEEVRDWIRTLAKELGYGEEDDLDIAA